MSRIDAQVATQVSDATRPLQSGRDQQLQVAVARQRSVSTTADDGVFTSGDAPGADEVHAAAAQIKQVIEAASGRQLSFAVDDTGKTLVVKVLSDKGEVIRQIPSKEVLDLRKRIDALVGAFFDEKA
jgi:flagellar protein FlaG